MDMKQFIQEQIRDLENMKDPKKFNKAQIEQLDEEIKKLKGRLKLYE